MFRVGWCSLIASCALWVCAADAQSAEQQLLIKVRICEEDPAGSVEAGTLKILAAPQLVTVAGTPAMLHVGGEVPLVNDPQSSDDYAKIGTSVELKPVLIGAEQVRLHLKLSDARRIDLPDSMPTRIETQTVETVLVAKLGSKTKISGTRQGKQHNWIEVTVEEVRPANQ